MRTLTTELNLRIDDYSRNAKLKEAVREYFELLRDYMQRQQLYSFVHTRRYF